MGLDVDPDMIVPVAMTIVTFAAVPWLLAQPVSHWHPQMKTRKAKRTYRRVTAVAALLAAAVGVLLDSPWLYLLAIAVALVLTVKWAIYPARQARAKAKADAAGHLRVTNDRDAE